MVEDCWKDSQYELGLGSEDGPGEQIPPTVLNPDETPLRSEEPLLFQRPPSGQQGEGSSHSSGDNEPEPESFVEDEIPSAPGSGLFHTFKVGYFCYHERLGSFPSSIVYSDGEYFRIPVSFLKSLPNPSPLLFFEQTFSK